MKQNISAMMNIQISNLRERAIDRLIFALDIGAGLPEALSWVDRLQGRVGLFKVGKESFTLYGPEIVRQIRDRGGRVFLDLKFHDIPNTVAGAAESAVKLGVSMFNIHALGGKKMMAATVASVRKTSEAMQSPMPVMLAVTVLTSLNDEDLRSLGFHLTTERLVLTLSKMAQDAGLTGVVASAQDVVSIREACGPDFLIVTPGIRGTGDTVQGDDQKRTLTPLEAIRRGADYLVIGRPIRMAEDPILAAEQIIGEISAGLRTRER
jgi:orotidine-5'-phosphate decarboxylase